MKAVKACRYALGKFANDDKWFSWLVLTPGAILMIVFLLIPLLQAAYYSLTVWNGIDARFVGFQNFVNIFQNQDFYMVLANNFLFLLAVPIIVILAMVCALIMYEEFFGWRFYRSVFFLPYVLSAVVVGFLFRSFFAYSGPINTLLQSIGLDSLAIDWLAKRPSGIFVIIMAVVWTQFGYAMLVYLAGLSSIDPSILEAARIDGAGGFKRFRYIVFPTLMRTTEFLVVLNTIFIFNSLFDFIYTITAGGPGISTSPISYWIYKKAFRSSEMGYACALAMVLFAILIVISYVQRAVANKADDWSE